MDFHIQLKQIGKSYKLNYLLLIKTQLLLDHIYCD